MHAMFLALLLQGLPATPPADTAVVCPAEFHAALAPWLAHRQQQGHVVRLISNRGTPDQIKSVIKAIAREGNLRFVVLVGDADGQDNSAQLRGLSDTALRLRQTPAHYTPAKVNVRWGSEPLIAGDNWYADLDDDHAPDVAIGRITADTAAELTLIVRKILAYEQTASLGAWRSRVNIVAGVGGFGTLADAVLEAATKQLIAGGIPSSYTTSMTYGSWRSPYCPDPRLFHDTTLERMNEGCLFWVYVGHGQRWYLDRVQVPGAQHHILDVRDMSKLRCANGSPIAFFLACYTAGFDGPYDCLAEELLRADGGPVAIVGGSRVTMPYAMAIFSTGLFEEFFHNRRQTLGEVLLHAKRSMVSGAKTGFFRQAIDSVGAALSPRGSDLAAERLEHLHLLNLIGDPLLRLRHPAQVTLEVPAVAAAGEPIEIVGHSPVDGPCTVELVLRRDRLGFKPPVRSSYDASPGSLASFQPIYDRANDGRLAIVQANVVQGRLTARLDIPATARGACHVRTFVSGSTRHAMGSADIRLEAAAASSE